MDAKYFCDTMNTELTSLKARVNNMVIRETDRMPEATRAGLGAQITEMHGMVDDIKAMIDDLGHECPADWSAQKQDIESLNATLTQKIDIWDAEHIAGGYVGG